MADWDADGREDAFVTLEDPHWCDEHGCRAAVFQSVSEGVRLISDFPSLRPPFFLSWNAVSRWRDLYVWEGENGVRRPRLERARILRFAGRGYYRYSRPRDANFPPPVAEEGEWLELEGAPSAAIERFEGMLRLGRDLQIFRRCGEAWRWAHDATRYGLEDAFEQWRLPLHRPGYVEIDATPHPHPARCEPCQRFSGSLTIFRVRRALEAPTHCASAPTS
ncbi:MAG: hypothetical protein HKP27_12820 [Myxococcales bacterium]|nr:hypothetical protein [Myxococcales bacterium]